MDNSLELITYDYNDTSVTVEYCDHVALECEEKFQNDNNSLMSCFLDVCFESPNLSFSSLILITSVFALIAIFGVVGNFAVCMVSKAQWLRHVPTTYLVNLAIADLANLIAGDERMLPFALLFLPLFMHGSIISIRFICA